MTDLAKGDETDWHIIQRKSGSLLDLDRDEWNTVMHCILDVGNTLATTIEHLSRRPSSGLRATQPTIAIDTLREEAERLQEIKAKIEKWL